MAQQKTKRNLRPVESARSEDVKRLFFAIDIPQETIAAAKSLVETFDVAQARVRWIHVVNLHITVKFLGDVEIGLIPKLSEAAEKTAAAFSPFDLSIDGMGIFPNQTKPRVVWLGVAGETEKLAAMESGLTKNLEPLGFPRDERPYSAHLTVGRVKSDSARGEVIRLVHKHAHVHVGPVPCAALELYESRLNPSGAIYTKLETFKLGG